MMKSSRKSRPQRPNLAQRGRGRDCTTNDREESESPDLVPLGTLSSSRVQHIQLPRLPPHNCSSTSQAISASKSSRSPRKLSSTSPHPPSCRRSSSSFCRAASQPTILLDIQQRHRRSLTVMMEKENKGWVWVLVDVVGGRPVLSLFNEHLGGLAVLLRPSRDSFSSSVFFARSQPPW